MEFLDVKLGSLEPLEGEVGEPAVLLGSEWIGQSTPQGDVVVPDQVAAVLPDLDVISEALSRGARVLDT